MFENAALQELYTGSLVAGKGRQLNNIRQIMERNRHRMEDWARVRFGAGTPWRRCWCVIEPPDEKDFQRTQKTMKKRSAYERPPVLKGDIKFYDTKKTKKVTPVATITDAYSAYAIYPQSKPLIDQSTLVKVEGRITIHSTPESKTEGFVFVMPEVHPAVSGFEMMLRWLFPVYDTFNLYGRPNRLIADTLDPRGLMFAMPKDKRYGYLDIIDVAGLIHTDGSQGWSEREWRKKMKEITSKRISAMPPARQNSNLETRNGKRTSLPAGTIGIRYEDGASIRSSQSLRHQSNQSTDTVFNTPKKSMTAPMKGQLPAHNYHARSASETVGFSPQRRRQEPLGPSRLSMDNEPATEQLPPILPNHPLPFAPYANGRPRDLKNANYSSQNSSDSDIQPRNGAVEEMAAYNQVTAPLPVDVAAPPMMTHQPAERPQKRPNPREELRRANSRMSNSTLSQMYDATRANGNGGLGNGAGLAATAAWNTRQSDVNGARGVNETTPNAPGVNADHMPILEGSIADSQVHDTPRSVSASRPTPVQSRSTERSLTQKPVSSPSRNSTEITRSEASEAAINPVEGPPTESLRFDEAPSIGSEDQTSTTSPDYASTRISDETQRSEKSISRLRTGVLKTVGDPSYQEIPLAPKVDIPNVDFGITQTLHPAEKSRPTTPADLINTASNSQPTTPGSAWGHGRTHSANLTPKDSRNSYFGRISPVDASQTSPQGSPHSGDRNMFWQPNGMTPRSPIRRVTAEEFVQQRAAANRISSASYTHQKNRSSGHVPAERAMSGDWSQRPELMTRPTSKSANMPFASGSPMSNSRPNSGDWTKRPDLAMTPSSRGAGQMITQNFQDYGRNLSAREQEHVAKMTGGPLLQVQQRATTPDPGVGLIGAITAREQEKEVVRQGLSSQTVQHAIHQRQLHEAQAQLQLQQAQQLKQQAQWEYSQKAYYHQQGQYGNPSSNQQNYAHPQQTQHQWVGPQAQTYRAGMSTPGQYTQRQPSQGLARYHSEASEPRRQ